MFTSKPERRARSITSGASTTSLLTETSRLATLVTHGRTSGCGSRYTQRQLSHVVGMINTQRQKTTVVLPRDEKEGKREREREGKREREKEGNKEDDAKSKTKNISLSRIKKQTSTRTNLPPHSDCFSSFFLHSWPPRRPSAPPRASIWASRCRKTSPCTRRPGHAPERRALGPGLGNVPAHSRASRDYDDDVVAAVNTTVAPSVDDDNAHPVPRPRKARENRVHPRFFAVSKAPRRWTGDGGGGGGRRGGYDAVSPRGSVDTGVNVRSHVRQTDRQRQREWGRSKMEK